MRMIEDIACLDSDIIAALVQAQAPEPTDMQLATRVRRGLMEHIKGPGRVFTVQADEKSWETFLPGVRLKVLHKSDGVMRCLVELSPGAEVPPHLHSRDEECLVLEGSLQIGDLSVSAGGFNFVPADLLHEHITTETGAMLFVRCAIPAEFEFRP